MDEQLSILLEKFLIKESCLYSFIYNMNKRWFVNTVHEYICKFRYNQHNSPNYDCLIYSAFSWNRTPEGLNFWRKINDNWSCFVYDNKIVYDNKNLIYPPKKQQFKSIW